MCKGILTYAFWRITRIVFLVGIFLIMFLVHPTIKCFMPKNFYRHSNYLKREAYLCLSLVFLAFYLSSFHFEKNLISVSLPFSLNHWVHWHNLFCIHLALWERDVLTSFLCHIPIHFYYWMIFGNLGCHLEFLSYSQILSNSYL